MNSFLKIAHRGFSLIKKRENTLFAFQNAIIKKFDMIELDIQLCKSKDIIIYHDSYIDYNNKFLFIKDLTFDEIHKINPYIITLPFLFENINKDRIKIYLDIKGNTEIIPHLLNFLNNRFNNFDNLILAILNSKYFIVLILFQSIL